MRGYLEIGNPFPQQEENDTTYPLHSLSTRQGQWAGVIYVHQSPESASKNDRSCEFIVISAGFALEGDDEQRDWIPEWDFEERPRSGDCYRFYHVLWIEWQGTVAYRRGLGRVSQKVWDDVSKEEVEVFG